MLFPEDQNPDADLLAKEQRPFDEKVTRDGGVFVEPGGREGGCDDDAAGCPPDDYVEDAWTGDDRPGTVDDIPYTMGVQIPDADDAHLVAEGGTHQSGRPARAEEPETELGGPDSRELWQLQKALIQEDEKDGIKLEGLSDEEAERVMEALGDEAADPLPDNPEGTSATGSPFGPEHGGFPERRE